MAQFRDLQQTHDPWDFVEREAAISEPRRRWILPPDACVSSDRLPVERPLSTDRLMGLWQGYVVEDFHPAAARPLTGLESRTYVNRRTKREIAEEISEGGGKKGRLAQVLPPPVWAKITACDLVGGSVGRAKYLLRVGPGELSGGSPGGSRRASGSKGRSHRSGLNLDNNTLRLFVWISFVWIS